MIRLPTLYQDFIHLSRYARWLPEEHRRETWKETVERYVDYMCGKQCRGKIPSSVKKEIRQAILALDVMPSMRAMMTAGRALERDNSAAYNCSYLAIDNFVAFDEMLYMLMCGCGVGYSVERQFIAQLPVVASTMRPSKTVIRVEDSKIGWTNAYRELISMLYQGRVPEWDVSEVRPGGTRLKTFGGRSSGPQPLEDLFAFTIAMFREAAGRRLNSIECHDICCKIADVVVVGGVRRSACISLSNPSDDRMRHAKSGNWGEMAPWRRLANNSVCYTEKPGMDVFMREWQALYESKSGERGIFNREAARKQVAKFGRRDPDHEWGCNPSLRRGTRLLTDSGIFPIDELEGTEFRTPNLSGQMCKAKCSLSGKNKPLYRIRLVGGHEYYATKEHKWPVLWGGEVRKFTTDHLRDGDKIPTGRRDSLPDGKAGDEDSGFLAGWVLGDGWITKRSDTGLQQVGMIVSSEDRSEGIATKLLSILSGIGSKAKFGESGELNTCNQAIDSLFSSVGMTGKDGGLPVSIWRSSEVFRKSVIDGLFSSDGCFCDGVSLTTAHENLARDVAELLGFYGIKTCVKSTTIEGDFPNGKDYGKTYTRYEVKVRHSLSIRHFGSIFSLSHGRKQRQLNLLCSSQKKSNSDNYVRVKSVELTDMAEDVWDVTVYDDDHCFPLAHCMTGNCSEILLRSAQFCVGSDTPLITSSTIFPRISEVEGKEVDIWNGEEWTPVTVRKTGESQKLVRVHLSDGSHLDCTPDHRWSVKDRFKKDWQEVQSKDLMSFSNYAVQIEPASVEHPNRHMGLKIKNPYTFGFAVGDGCVYGGAVLIDLHGPKDWDCPIVGTRQKPQLNHAGTSTYVRSVAEVDRGGVAAYKSGPDAWYQLGTWNRDDFLQFVAGLADADGSETGTGGIRIYVGEYGKGQTLQLALSQNGIRCSLNLHQEKGVETNLGIRQTDSWYVQITECQDIPCHRLDTSGGHEPKFKGKFQVIRAVEELDGLHNTYCFTEPKRHKAMFGNVLTYQCNLSEVVVRPKDTLRDLKRKVRIAVIVGTMQATLTNFRYLRPIWRENTEEEALLGVSLTGVLDSELMSGRKGRKELRKTLSTLREYAVKVNQEWSAKLGINPATAVTCNKPSGCATLDTKIKTDRGILSFAEIFRLNGVKPSEMVDGRWIEPTVQLRVRDNNNDEQRISKLYVNGVSDVYEIEDEVGNSYRFTGNHKLETKTGWKRVDEMTTEDEIGRIGHEDKEN